MEIPNSSVTSGENEESSTLPVPSAPETSSPADTTGSNPPSVDQALPPAAPADEETYVALPENWGRPGHLTLEQQETTNDFVRRHGTALDLTKYPTESPENTALRFLRARKFDVALAGDLLADCNRRKSEGGALFCKMQSAEVCARCDVAAMKKFYPHTMSGFDKQGRPILWELSGALNVTALLVMMSKETLINYHWWTMETKLANQFTAAAERQHFNPPNATFAVLDFAGFGLGHLTPACMNQLKCFISIDNVCYPETLGKLLVINAPWLAVNSWGLVKSWLDPRTVAKIEILSATDSVTRLHDLIDKNQIPPCYGGTGPNLYFPKPNTELVSVPRSGEVLRYFDLPAGSDAVVDSYVADGALECLVCVVSVVEALKLKALKPPPSLKNLSSGHGPERILLQRKEMSPNTKDGVPERLVCAYSSGDLGTDSGDSKVLVALWANSARLSSRNLVYVVTVSQNTP